MNYNQYIHAFRSPVYLCLNVPSKNISWIARHNTEQKLAAAVVRAYHDDTELMQTENETK